MISCEKYDYIEIACLYRFPITLILHNAQKITAIAVDTQRNAQQRECIKLLTEPHQRSILVELQSIARLEVNINNPHFLSVDFD